ncbi:MAG: Formate hydrogenlyase subunit 7 [Nitrosomonadaceae bacterium]|nr:Formate hydrogenlyase subunit 7 [Nitrosomonadaceae bacterium]
MTLLRLLNLLFFGPRVTLHEQNFTQVKANDFEVVGEALSAVVKDLYSGRALRIRAVNAGSSNAEEQELSALSNAYYDLERFGLSFVASPRHADILFVTGPVTRNMERALRTTYAAAPQPCLVIAIGDGACAGGLWKDSYAVVGPVDAVIPVHVRIPGDPPSPTNILRGVLQALESARA